MFFLFIKSRIHQKPTNCGKENATAKPNNPCGVTTKVTANLPYTPVVLVMSVGFVEPVPVFYGTYHQANAKQQYHHRYAFAKQRWVVAYPWVCFFFHRLFYQYETLYCRVGLHCPFRALFFYFVSSRGVAVELAYVSLSGNTKRIYQILFVIFFHQMAESLLYISQSNAFGFINQVEIRPEGAIYFSINLSWSVLHPAKFFVYLFVRYYN